MLSILKEESARRVCPVTGAEQGRRGMGLSQANVERHRPKDQLRNTTHAYLDILHSPQTRKFKEEEVGLNIP